MNGLSLRTTALTMGAVLAATAIGGCGHSASPAAPQPAAASVAPSPPTSEAAIAEAKHTFPVSGNVSYGRTHAEYPATDIIAACGLPVLAATDGTILEVSRVDTFDKANPRGAERGGLSVSLVGADGVRYYGSHLTAIADGIEVGARVASGQQLGTVGKTGNASNTCHLHFGISPPCQKTGDWWVRRGVVYPWRYLDAWRAGQSLSPVSEVANWERTHGCPASPPPGG